MTRGYFVPQSTRISRAFRAPALSLRVLTMDTVSPLSCFTVEEALLSVLPGRHGHWTTLSLLNPPCPVLFTFVTRGGPEQSRDFVQARCDRLSSAYSRLQVLRSWDSFALATSSRFRRLRATLSIIACRAAHSRATHRWVFCCAPRHNRSRSRWNGVLNCSSPFLWNGVLYSLTTS